MSRLLCSLTILVALLCSALAQSSPSSIGQPINCQAASNMPNVNISQFNGTWFEAARQPDNGWECVEIDIRNFTSDNNNILNINVTVATNPNMLNMNISMNANITLDTGNTAGYNVSYTTGSVTKPNVTLKLLDTDYNNYAFVCGFTNVSDPSTYFGAILTRQRVPSASALTQYQTQAASEYSDFTKNMTLITQSDKCYTVNGASSSVPALATVFAVLFAIVKHFV